MPFFACLSLTLIRLTCFGNLCWSLFHRLHRNLRVRVLSVFGMFIANAVGFDLLLIIWIFFGVCVCVAASTTPHSRALQLLCRVVARFMLPLVAVHRRACTSSHWKLSLYSRHWRTDCAIPTPCLNGVVPVVSGLDADIRDAHVRRKPHVDAIWRRAQMHRIAHHNEQSRYMVSMSVSHLPMCTSLDILWKFA